jgi:hypothetical protein
MYSTTKMAQTENKNMPIREYRNMREERPIEKVQKPFPQPAKQTSVPF